MSEIQYALRNNKHKIYVKCIGYYIVEPKAELARADKMAAKRLLILQWPVFCRKSMIEKRISFSGSTELWVAKFSSGANVARLTPIDENSGRSRVVRCWKVDNDPFVAPNRM